jgi:3-deoxy-D-manno-octulosonate 8-phosphate phosphatase (KDO 8-P phosphatase)
MNDQISENQIQAKAKKIKLAIFDVDGVMTDGTLYFRDTDDVAIGFNIQDGLGIQLLHQAGIQVAIITGRSGNAVPKRAAMLGIQHLYTGCSDKFGAYTELKTKLGVQDEEVAYAGDDWIDIPVMRHVGLKIAVPNAVAEVKAIADWQTPRAGGQGAVRDISDLLLKAQGHFENLLKKYFK